MPIFATSASRAAIEAASDVHHFALDEALGQLVEMSLVDATDELDLAQRRYSVHPLTRAFTTAKLQREPEIQQGAQQRLAEFFRLFTKEHGGFWYHDGFAHLEIELPNIVASIQWCWREQFPQMGMDVLYNILGFMIINGYWNDVLALGQQAVEQATEIGDELSAARWKIGSVSWIHRHRGDLDLAEEYAAWALAVFERLGDERYTAYTKRNLGQIAQERGEFDRAERLLRESLTFYQSTGDKHDLVFATTGIAMNALKRGDLVLHHSRNDMSVILSRSVAEAKNLVVCLGKCPCLPKTRFFVASLLRMTSYQNQCGRVLDAAWSLSNDALASARQIDDLERVATLLGILGNVAHRRDNYKEAKKLWEEALVNMRQANHHLGIADAQFQLAQIEIEMGETQIPRHRLLEALDKYRRLDIQSKVQEVEALLAKLPEPMDQTE